MKTRISVLCAAAALGFAVSPAQSAGTNLNTSPGKAPPIASPQAITTSSANQVFTAITPCRAFGAQVVTGNQTKIFLISGSSSFAGQNGPAAGCGVPTYATAVSINLSAAASAAGGFTTAFATGTARPAANSLTMQHANTTTSGSIVALGSAGRISIYASKVTTVYGDVTGYFSPATYSASIFADGTVNRGEGVNTATTQNLGTGQYEVGFTRDITECFFQVTAGEGGIGSAAPRLVGATRRSGNPNGVFIQIRDNANVAVNNDFYVLVSCGK